MNAPLRIVALDPDQPDDFLAVAGDYLRGWVYSRPPDRPLLNHWKSLAGFQPDQIRIAYRGDTPRAVLHGELHDQGGTVHLLASRPDAGEDAFALLNQFDRLIQSRAGRQWRGPFWGSAVFYGGYVLGNEPYIPSWDTPGTCAFVRAGCRMEIRGVLLVRPLQDEIPQEPVPAGYEIVPAARGPEYDAQPFGYHALFQGQKAAHCYARFYPHLTAPGGGPVGQVGNVTTEANHRGQGLARIMVKRCLRDLRAMGAAEALIATSLDNFPALKAYENAGFERRFNMNYWVKDLHALP